MDLLKLTITCNIKQGSLSEELGFFWIYVSTKIKTKIIWNTWVLFLKTLVSDIERSMGRKSILSSI